MWRRVIGGIILSGLFVAAGCQAPSRAVPTEPRLDEFARVQNVQALSELLRVARERPITRLATPPDWDALLESYKPRVLVAPTMQDARAAMRMALREAGRTAMVLLPREMFRDLPVETDGAVGFDVRIVDGAALVVDVRPRTPAARAGIQPGWELLSIDAVDVRDWVRRGMAAGAPATRSNLLIMQRLHDRLAGPRDSTVALRFQDGDDRVQAYALERARPWGKRVRVGDLPPEYVYSRAHTLDGDVGYIKLSALLDADEHLPVVRAALQRHDDQAGVVLDLRGSSTGVPSVAAAIAGLLLDGESGEMLGTFETRFATADIRLSATTWRYTGPLAVLVDDCTASAGEFLARLLQDRGRARIFGQTAAGAALPSIFATLPNGDRVHYPTALYRMAGDTTEDLVALIPDQKLIESRAALLKGEDRILTAATRWLRAQPREPDPAPAMQPADDPQARAAGIIEASIAARGGRAAFEALTSRILDGRLEIVPHGLSGKWQVYEQAPDLHYERVTIDSLGTREEGTNGDVHWTLVPNSEPLVHTGDAAALRNRKTRFNSHLYWRELYPGTRHAGSEVVDGRKCEKVEFVPAVGEPHVVYYDQKTKLPYKHVARVVTGQGEQKVETISEDYRTVDGIELAHLTIVRVVGTPGEQRTQVLRVAHNVEIPAGRFAVPPEVQALLDGSHDDAPATQPAAADDASP